MDHYAGRYVTLPENRTVVTIERNKLIEERLLAFLECHMSERLEYPPCRSNCHLRHRRITGLGQKLCQIRRDDYTVF